MPRKLIYPYCQQPAKRVEGAVTVTCPPHAFQDRGSSPLMNFSGPLPGGLIGSVTGFGSGLLRQRFPNNVTRRGARLINGQRHWRIPECYRCGNNEVAKQIVGVPGQGRYLLVLWQRVC